jgi:hypothetical protein
MSDLTVAAGAWVRACPTATDAEGEPLAFTLDPMPSGATLRADGCLIWPTSRSDVATWNLVLFATDGRDTVQDAFTIRVLLPETAPAAPDSDGDGVQDPADNCPSTTNLDQADRDADGRGDACSPAVDGSAPPPAEPELPPVATDTDLDGVPDVRDDCPARANADQADLDGDGLGDACDPDLDGDGVAQGAKVHPDNCAMAPNPQQQDLDGDGLGDACDPDVPAAARDPVATAQPAAGPEPQANGAGAALAATAWIVGGLVGAAALAGVVLRRRA